MSGTQSWVKFLRSKNLWWVYLFLSFCVCFPQCFGQEVGYILFQGGPEKSASTPSSQTAPFACGPLQLEMGQVQLTTAGSWAVKEEHSWTSSEEKKLSVVICTSGCPLSLHWEGHTFCLHQRALISSYTKCLTLHPQFHEAAVEPGRSPSWHTPCGERRAE